MAVVQAGAGTANQGRAADRGDGGLCPGHRIRLESAAGWCCSGSGSSTEPSDGRHCPRERIVPELLAHQRGETVGTATEVHPVGGHTGWNRDHVATFTARSTACNVVASVPGGTRTVAAPISITDAPLLDSQAQAARPRTAEPLQRPPAQMPSRSHRSGCLPAAARQPAARPGATRTAAAELTRPAAQPPIPSRGSHSSRVVSRIFRTFGLAEQRPALAHAVMAPRPAIVRFHRGDVRSRLKAHPRLVDALAGTGLLFFSNSASWMIISIAARAKGHVTLA
jgi:hypothetical protein